MSTEPASAAIGGGVAIMPVRVLVVEDDALDAQLMLEALREDGIVGEHRIVQDDESYRRALQEFRPDIVLSDLSLPGFSGNRALTLLREHDARTPFVFVSGTIGEAAAIEALRAGATDYILKNNMARLASAVRRAIAEADERRARDLAEDELVRTQRFQTLAILAGSLSHDLRNTLQPVLLAADLIRVNSADAEVIRLCAMIRDCSEQGLQLASAMLALARGGQGAESQRIRLNALLEAISMLLKPSLPKATTLVIGPVDPALEVPGNANELQQCLLNLALNASQAMPNGGRLEISAQPFQPDALFFSEGEPRVDTAYVRIAVIDTGHGMDADTLARLFTPFFTTKESGTGLGLVSCRRFVENHRGVIRVHSQPGTGSRFELYLPVEVAENATRTGAEDDGLIGHGERVLVLSSNDQERSDLGDILELYGYQPILLANGQETAARLATDPHAQVAIVDRDLIVHHAGNAIVYLRSAGFTGPLVVIGASGRSIGISGSGQADTHLSKPVTAPTLLRALRTALSPAPVGTRTHADSAATARYPAQA